MSLHQKIFVAEKRMEHALSREEERYADYRVNLSPEDVLLMAADLAQAHDLIHPPELRRAAARNAGAHHRTVKRRVQTYGGEWRCPVRVFNSKKLTCNRYFYHVEYRGHEYKLVYAPKQKAICTFLLPDATS